jgi:hypothetical protein
LNYDGVIETFCENNGISYSDGFDPYWNPNNFDTKDVKIFKLHGSLYWFKTEKDKILRVPVKGLEVTNLRYLSDETLSEMIIYPALQKDKNSEVYLWIHNRFLFELNEAHTCVVMGYSFRDKEVRENLLGAMNTNPDLWLIVVSPNATKHKNEYLRPNLEIASRILTIDRQVEEIIGDRKIGGYIDSLNTVRSVEQDIWREQAYSIDYLKDKIGQVVSMYGSVGKREQIHHSDRIEWINSKIAQRVVG